MKKYLAILCATLLCVCCLGLAACGGSASSSAASSSAASASGSASASASASASSSSADPTAQFVGDWKLAGMGFNGITVYGDFSSSADFTMDASLSIKADGTGTLSISGSAIDFTWTASGDNAIAAKLNTDVSQMDLGDNSAAGLAEGMGDTLNLQYKDGVISLVIENEGQTGTLMFSKDGTLPNAVVIDPAKAKPITQESELIGTWKVTGATMMGVTMYGDSEAIAQSMGMGSDMAMTFEAGGKCSLSGSESTYTVGSNGATIEESGVVVTILSYDGDLLMDYSSLLPGMYMLLEK